MKLNLRLEMNPIVIKELRSRMRGWRAFAVLTGVLAFLAGISYLLYRVVLESTRYSSTPVSPIVGQTLFMGLAMVELMMICFVTPAVTAGTISSEQERLTYEMLLATPLKPGRVLWGKLISALSYVFLLILAAVPLSSLVFIFGGVALRDMVKALAVLLATAVTLGVVGVFMSTWLRRTVRATVLSYLVVLGLLVGPVLVFVFVGVLQQREPPRWILIPNPVSALFSAMAPVSSSGNPVGFLGELGWILSGNLSRVMGGAVVQGIPRPLYHYTLPLYGLLSLVLYLLSTRLVRPLRRWRIRWHELLVALALFLILGGVAAVPFLLTAGRYEMVESPVAPTAVPIGPVPPVVVERVVAVTQIVEVEPVPTLPPVPSPTPAFSEPEQAEIYAAVIRQLYTVDHTFEGQHQFPLVYLLCITDDAIGDPEAPHDAPQMLSEPLQGMIVELLSDLPAKFIWVSDRQQVPIEQNSGVVQDGGAIFTVGNIHLDKDERVLVSASLYFSSLGGGGQTYVLEKVDGIWRIAGNTGVKWIS